MIAEKLTHRQLHTRVFVCAFIAGKPPPPRWLPRDVCAGILAMCRLRGWRL